MNAMSKVFLGILVAIATILSTHSLAKAQVLTSFEFSDMTSGPSKIAGIPFNVTITAKDENGSTMTSFTGTANLSDTTGTLSPNQTTAFTNGVWSGQLNITKATTNTTLTASNGFVSNSSASFAVYPDSRIKFLTILSGNNQANTVGQPLNNALTIRVVDPYNNPLSGVGVNYAVSSVPQDAQGYSLSSNSTTTNSAGDASTTFTLGRKAGTYIITSTLTSGVTNTAHFYETALPGTVTSLQIHPSSIVVIPTGSFIPFTAVGLDQYANQIEVSPITWTVQNGGGTIDATGMFYAGNTIGTYSNTIRASFGSVGSTASVTIVGSSGGVAGIASGSGVEPTPIPTPTYAPPQNGVLYDVQVDPEVISALRNIEIPILAEAIDIFGNVVSGVTYDFNVSGGLGKLTQTGPNSALLQTSAEGIGVVKVTATQGDRVVSTNVVGSVGNGINRRLVIEDIISPQRVGEPFTISIAAKDIDNNFVTDYSGPIVLADTTGTLDPSVVPPNESGIWYVQAVINLAHPEVSITAAGDGMVGVSNIFEVIGNPKKSEVGPGLGGLGGVGEVLGASVSAILDQLLLDEDYNKLTIFRYIGSGLAAGFGILGASIGGGIMVSRGLEAIGRNPFAKNRLKANLYASLLAFVIAASLAVFAAFLILK